MNNATNRIKKRADVLAEYMIDRCDKLEKENSYMRQSIQSMEGDLSEYGWAFWKVLKKTETIVRREDGTIDLKYKDENGTEMGVLIMTANPLYPIAEILFERWRKKRKW